MRFLELAIFTFSALTAVAATHVRILVRPPSRAPRKFKRWSDVDLYGYNSYNPYNQPPPISYNGFQPLNAPNFANLETIPAPETKPFPELENPAPASLPLTFAAPSPPATPEAKTEPPATEAPATEAPASTPASLPTGEPILVSQLSETVSIGLPHPLTPAHLGLHPSQIDHEATNFYSQFGLHNAQVINK